MKKARFATNQIADQPALAVGNLRRPDRRQISARWLAGTFLTGLTSCTLMGIALFTALDGREQLATPPELMSYYALQGSIPSDNGEGEKGQRIALTLPKQTFEDRKLLEISTEQRVGDKSIIRTQPFELIRMTLAEEPQQKVKYPAFNALDLFTNGPIITTSENDPQIYGAKVESEISLRVTNFPKSAMDFEEPDSISDVDAEKSVRTSQIGVSDAAKQVALLQYVDPTKFGSFDSNFALLDTLDVRIIKENVSIAARSARNDTPGDYNEDIIPIVKNEAITAVLNNANYQGDDVQNLADALAYANKNATLDAGNVLRLGFRHKTGQDSIVRASIYNGVRHVLSIALNDNKQFVTSQEPEMTPALQTTLEGGMPVARVPLNRLPSVYDAVYNSALKYDLSKDTIHQLMRMLATDIDLQSKITPNDSLEVFYPLTENGKTTENRQILYVNARLGDTTHKYYRFQSQDGSVDYYDSDGRSSKQFLIRKPVPNGYFTSPFGYRRHPVLGYERLHSGVDWAAMRGTPIIAAGDGVVSKIGVTRGYGNHTEIQHGNGYMTSYSHQNGFAPDMKLGTRVKQGQIIGYVGSTGLSSGPHCHFEVVVNGKKVDPMRVRIPDNKALAGTELATFKSDRDRINTFMNPENATRVATAAYPTNNNQQNSKL